MDFNVPSTVQGRLRTIPPGQKELRENKEGGKYGSSIKGRSGLFNMHLFVLRVFPTVAPRVKKEKKKKKRQFVMNSVNCVATNLILLTG